MSYQIRTAARNQDIAPVRDAMAARPLRVAVQAGTPFELLIGLYATGTPSEERAAGWAPRLEECPPATRAALEAVGASAGEIWLHLLGLALGAGADDAASLVDAVAAVRPLELRRHLLGIYVPAWVELVGRERLEAAARGDTEASAQLLAHDRYYGGRARESLALLLPLTAAETKRHLLAALLSFAEEVFASHEGRLRAQLEEEADGKRALAETLSGRELITAAARGYVYEPEPEFARVVLVPHFAARPWTLLCQHRDARVICYGVMDVEAGPAEQLERLGRALGDAKRVAILLRLRRSPAAFAELAEEVGLSRSTTHHHLALLRAAGLITLHGNARNYRYTLDAGGFAAAESLLGSFATAS